MPEQDLNNKRALVTGGARGIGAATALTLIERGAQVVICGRTAPTQPVGDAHFITADLGSATGPEQLAAATLEALGSLDILVNNAGGQITHAAIEEFSDEDWQQELQIHLLASVKLDRALLPALTETAGSIVHVSSAVARLPEPAVIAYASAKAALGPELLGGEGLGG